MEKTNQEKLKEIFLVSFVVLCVGLVFALWVNAFSEKDAETPYFYRGVPEISDSFGATLTASAGQPVSGSTPTPEIHKHQNTPTPTPTTAPTEEILPDFTPESDG